jgi:hypothetical protein
MKVLFVLLAFMATAQAQGASYIGLCHPDTNCRAVKETWRNQDTIITGWLETTFGQECKCADELLKSRKPKVVRVHLLNGPCLRNNRCGPYEAFYGYSIEQANQAVHKPNSRLMRRFRSGLQRLRKRLAGAEGVQCYVSPCLECDLNERARRNLLSVVSAVLPDCIPVDNPLRSRCIAGYTCEKHGVAPRVSVPCIVDLDGIDGSYIDVDKFADRYRHCDISFYWEPFMNCIRGSFIDPRKRNCRYESSMYQYIKGVLCLSFLRQSFDICSR